MSQIPEHKARTRTKPPLSQEAAKDLTRKHVKGKTQDAEARRLKSPENLRAWREELLAFKADLETQIKERRATLSRASARLDRGKIDNAEYRSIKADLDEWRASTGRVLVGVERDLMECKRLIAQSARGET